jgi:hypothetical protein
MDIILRRRSIRKYKQKEVPEKNHRQTVFCRREYIMTPGRWCTRLAGVYFSVIVVIAQTDGSKHTCM